MHLTCKPLGFDPPAIEGIFVRRYKRFFADVELPGIGRVVTHCPNTGSLRGCLLPGARALVTPATNPNRKLKYTWRAIEVGGSWVGVDTSLAETLVQQALERGVIDELRGFHRMQSQVVYGAEGRSRIDFLLTFEVAGQRAAGARVTPVMGEQQVYVEVKNTTLMMPERWGRRGRRRRRFAAFPDAVTERGRKHLYELAHVLDQGHRAALVLCVQRSDCEGFIPAEAIDPTWTASLREVVARGVEVYALTGRFGAEGFVLDRRLPVWL